MDTMPVVVPYGGHSSVERTDTPAPASFRSSLRAHNGFEPERRWRSFAVYRSFPYRKSLQAFRGTSIPVSLPSPDFAARHVLAGWISSGNAMTNFCRQPLVWVAADVSCRSGKGLDGDGVEKRRLACVRGSRDPDNRLTDGCGVRCFDDGKRGE